MDACMVILLKEGIGKKDTQIQAQIVSLSLYFAQSSFIKIFHNNHVIILTSHHCIMKTNS